MTMIVDESRFEGTSFISLTKVWNVFWNNLIPVYKNQDHSKIIGVALFYIALMVLFGFSYN